MDLFIFSLREYKREPESTWAPQSFIPTTVRTFQACVPHPSQSTTMSSRKTQRTESKLGSWVVRTIFFFYIFLTRFIIVYSPNTAQTSYNVSSWGTNSYDLSSCCIDLIHYNELWHQFDTLYRVWAKMAPTPYNVSS